MKTRTSWRAAVSLTHTVGTSARVTFCIMLLVNLGARCAGKDGARCTPKGFHLKAPVPADFAEVVFSQHMVLTHPTPANTDCLHLGDHQHQPTVRSLQRCNLNNSTVMSSVAEGEIGALYINCREAIQARRTLEYLGQRQPPTPMQTDNTTALRVINNNIMNI